MKPRNGGVSTSCSSTSFTDKFKVKMNGKNGKDDSDYEDESEDQEDNARGKSSTKEEDSKTNDVESENNDQVHKSRLNKLQFLLERSQIYSKIMSDKMRKEKSDREQKEKRQIAKQEEDGKSKGEKENVSSMAKSTRSGGAEHEEVVSKTASSEASTKKSKRDKKQDEKYLISEYLNEDNLKASAAPTKLAKDTDQVTTSFQQPKLITGATLRDYQLYGVEWLIGLYENGLNGILADEMGLGKTLQTIAFLAHLKIKNQYGPFLVVCPASTLQNWMDEIARFAPEMRALLFYSSDKKQRKRWVDQHRKEPKSAKERLEFPIFVTSYEIAINDSRLLGSLRWKFIVVDEGHRLKNQNARLTKELKSYYSANRLILTGTPVHNNLAELWSLLNFILPDVFDNLDEFESWFDFSDLHSEGGSAKILSREQSQNVISTLRGILDPFILQREKKHVEKDLPPKKEYMLYAPLTAQQKELYTEVLNNSIRARLTELMTGMTWEEIKQTEALSAGEGWDEPLHGQKDGASALNGKNNRRTILGQNEQIHSNGSSKPASGTSTPAKRGIDEMQELDESEGSIASRRKAPRKSRKSALQYIEDDETEKQFMDRMESGKSSKRGSRRNTGAPPSDDEEFQSHATVSILDVQRQSREHAVRDAQKQIANMRLQNPIMQLRKICGHPFLLYWPRDPDSGELVSNRDLINASGKMLMLNRLLDALWSRGHKVLLFSQFTTMLDILEEWCEDYKGVRPLRIDGNVDVHSRSRLMKEFNTGKGPDACKLFLLSTRSGGLGVNLVAADTVIFYDTDWNPQMDRQAQDRAHRIGQTKPVLVFRLVTRDTAEERIVKRAFAKQQLSTLVMSGDQFSKQTTAAASAFAKGRPSSRVEEWTAMLQELRRESVQFEIADKDSDIISDEQLNLLLDRSPAAYEKRDIGWSASKGKNTFEVSDVLEAMEREQDDVDIDNDRFSQVLGDGGEVDDNNS